MLRVVLEKYNFEWPFDVIYKFDSKNVFLGKTYFTCNVWNKYKTQYWILSKW